jgi:hypothetical protein
MSKYKYKKKNTVHIANATDIPGQLQEPLRPGTHER